MNRAYATLEIKSVADANGRRQFRGIASTPSTDRMGDVVEPKGAQFNLPIPLLWQHDSRQPIGWVTSAKVTDKGIEIDGEVAQISEDGPLKNRLTEAWQMLQAKLVRGLSIGFNALESARIDGTFGMKFLKWEWLELSAVTIPANQEATITAIKSTDQRQRAAIGHTSPPDRRDAQPPGASGTKQQPASGGFSFSRSQKGTEMKTIQELREAREQKAARMNELVQMREAEQRKSTDEEATEFDGLSDEVKELDDEIRLTKMHAINSGTAKPVDGSSANAASRSRSADFYVKSSDVEEKFPGQNYVRMIIAKSVGKILDESPVAIAQHRWGKSNPTLVRLIKAGVAGGGSASGEWGAELVNADTRYTGDFLTYLYSQTIYDRLPLRNVPANVMIKGQDGQGTGYWVGEAKSIPATTADFVNVSLTPLKVAALTAVSNEWIRDSDPSGEMLVRDALVQASSQRVDTTFLSATAASAGVSPAGLLNGLTGIACSGTDAAALRADIMSLYTPFLAAKNASGIHLVMTPSLAKALSLLVNSLGQTEFPGLNASGGTLLGDPVVTGENVTSGNLIAIKPSDVYRIGDTGIQVSMTREAMIEMDSAPAGEGFGPTTASANMVSMWQAEMTGFKVVRSINFAKRRTSAVAFIHDAEYGGVVS